MLCKNLSSHPAPDERDDSPVVFGRDERHLPSLMMGAGGRSDAKLRHIKHLRRMQSLNVLARLIYRAGEFLENRRLRNAS